MTDKVNELLSENKIKCGCDRGKSLQHKYALIDITNINGVNIYEIKVGRNLDSYAIYEEIIYCPFCGNRLDGGSGANISK